MPTQSTEAKVGSGWVGSRRVKVDFDGGRISPDAEALLVRISVRRIHIRMASSNPTSRCGARRRRG